MKTMYKNKNLPITKHLSFISPSPSKKENEPEKRTIKNDKIFKLWVSDTLFAIVFNQI